MNRRLAVVAFAVLFVILVSACEDFYSDSLPTPDIAQPTPANPKVGDPAEILEVAAREAMAARLGISVDAPRKILFEDETWTDKNPGCYPAPESITGAYLIPGYRLLMQHDGVFYEYDADQGAGTGALCDSTLQLIPVEPAYSIVTLNEVDSPDVDVLHILRSEDDVAEFNSAFSETALIGVEEIDFPEEVLVGGWVEASPNPEVVRAYRSGQGTSIIIEVAIPEEFEEEASDDLSPVWALIDFTDTGSTYEFIVTE